METLTTAPEASSFVLLAEHQSRTPSSFHSGPPVLHYHNKRCKVVVLERDLVANAPLNAIRGQAAATANGAGATEEDADAREVEIDNVNVWVTSEKFLLYAPTTNAGISIPYPSISLHAIQRLRLPNSPDQPEVQGLYMQIATPSASGMAMQEDDEEESITMTIVPPEMAAEQQQQQQQGGEGEGESEENKPNDAEAETETETPTQRFYAAVSACSNLHPDPVEPGDEDEDEDGEENSLFQSGVIALGNGEGAGGLPPPVDGSSGWITAENMNEYFDEDGNWIAGGEAPGWSLPLGPGAGTVRQREDEMDEDERQEEEGDGEMKWRRTD